MANTIKLKGSAARNFMAELLVDSSGEAAIEKCSGEMLEAVKAVLAERIAKQASASPVSKQG